MEKITVYHGSNVEVAEPRIIQNGFYKDFGYGFYCTILEKQAKRWAMTKKGDTIINCYTYIPNVDLKMLSFSKMTEEWLDFVANCRHGIEHDYDIVEGPIADDKIWNFVELFINGDIPRSAFWDIIKFNYPTHQILFRTDEAIKTLSFEGSYSYEK